MTVRPIALRIGRNLRSLEYKSDPTERATEIAAKCGTLGGVDTFLGGARFRVTSSNSGAKTFVIVDPAGGTGAVGFDDQLNGWSILRETTGEIVAITDSVQSSQLVTLASWPSTGSAMADGEYVQFRDEDGLVPYKLTHPVYAAASDPGIGPKFRSIDRGDKIAVANLCPNAVQRDWPSGDLPTGWSVYTWSGNAATTSKNTNPLYTQRGGQSIAIDFSAGGGNAYGTMVVSPPIPYTTTRHLSAKAALLLKDWTTTGNPVGTNGIELRWGVMLGDGSVKTWPEYAAVVVPPGSPILSDNNGVKAAQVAGDEWITLAIEAFDVTVPSQFANVLASGPGGTTAGLTWGGYVVTQDDLDNAIGYVLVIMAIASTGETVYWDGLFVCEGDATPDEVTEFGDANGVYQDVQAALGKLAPPQYTFAADVLDLKRLNPSLDEDDMDRGAFVAISSSDLGIVNDVQRITDARINDLVEGDTTITVEPRLKRYTRRLIEGAQRTVRATSAAIRQLQSTTSGTGGAGGSGGTGGATIPTVSLSIAFASDVPTLTATVNGVVVSVKMVLATSDWATDADALTDARAATADTTPPFTLTGAAVSPGDTVYAAAVAYDANGVESVLARTSATDPVVGFGSRVSMPILWTASGSAGINEFQTRWYSNDTVTLASGGGRDGNDAVEEADVDCYEEYAVPTGSGDTTERCYQFGFDCHGLTIPYEVPLLQLYPTIVAVTMDASRKIKLYVDDGSGGTTLLGTTTSAVPGTGPVVGTLRVKYGATGTGYLCLRINGETLRFTSQTVYAAGNGSAQFFSAEFMTGSGQFFFAPPGYTDGIALRWFDLYVFDATGQSQDDHPGDVHTAILRPSGAGSNSGGTGAYSDMQTDDGDTSYVEFSAINDIRTVAVDDLPGSVVTVLGVAPYFYHRATGPAALRQCKIEVKSSGTTVESNATNALATYTGQYPTTTNGTRYVLTTDPNTSAAWTISGVNAMEVGMKAVTLPSGTIRVSMVGAEVAYWDS